jgi:hypothetical protein
MTDTITKTVDFGLDIEGKTFDVSIAVWDDGMMTTSAKYAYGTFNELESEDYETLLVTDTSPTILDITDAIDYARQLEWERNEERMQG